MIRTKVAELLCRLKPRRRSWDETSTWIVFAFAIACWAEAGFYGYVIKRFGPDYLNLSNQPGAWSNPRFLLCGFVLAVVGVQCFAWRIAAKSLTTILEKRFSPD